ncbi:ImmA/IrrE family metallo-endopeptidase [Anaerophilus nitritogenes]|uniref:ImmA/IrrE family metallo-endopeptidase n=1 Tax=Anaerophilus nitritogenes TaxID=2498136 RepID=UPI00101DEDE4|nr:ImmA/IrrE family metallo-endopeptidase [Anaerophilus nitritogenes]
MDEYIIIAKKIHQLETNGELRVIYRDLDNVNGVCYEKNNQYIIIINSKLNYEKQLETVWHEAKHICSHIGCVKKNTNYEKEAIDFSKNVLKHPEIIQWCKTAL